MNEMELNETISLPLYYTAFIMMLLDENITAIQLNEAINEHNKIMKERDRNE